MKRLLIKFSPLLDILLTPIVYSSAWLLKNVREAGIKKFPNCKNALDSVGIFPILDHYYEPQFNFTTLEKPLSQDRVLPGIDWNVNEQLKILSTFSFSQELSNIQSTKTDALDFHFNNEAFESGDAEYWYQLIRYFKPKRIFEIGSGNSTLMAIKAIKANHDRDANYKCKHVCIEPYEMEWLEKADVSVIRKKVECVGTSFFSELEENDVLFIDSSHIIRPQGDVLYEYLELLPTLNIGVIVHIHDIFSPKNYLEQWVKEEVRLWNEQYLLEAFLSHNDNWKIIGALNYLQHNHHEKLKPVAPFLTLDREPGSFYIQRVR